MLPSLLKRSLRRLLFAAHRSALQKKQAGMAVGHVEEEQLLMVHYPNVDNKAVLRTVNELESPGDIKYSIPYRSFCGYTMFQGWLTFFCLWTYIHRLPTVTFDQHL